GQPDRAGSMCCGNDAVIGGRSTYPDPVVVQWIGGRHIPAFRESIHPGSEPYESTAHIPYAFPAAPPRACSYDDGQHQSVRAVDFPDPSQAAVQADAVHAQGPDTRGDVDR